MLATLRAQLGKCRVKGRDFTGRGFMTTFVVSLEAEPITLKSGNFKFGDVIATIKGLNHGAGFVVYVENGFLDALEAYTFDEPWPDRIESYALEYLRKGEQRNLSGMYGV